MNAAKNKKTLNRYFCEYIRLRDAIGGYGFCISCGKRVEYPNSTGNWHAGHYYPRSTVYANLYFDEMNVNGQCLTEESNVRLINGKHRSIKDLRVGDEICGFDEQDYKEKDSVVEDVHSFIPQELYEVEMENGDTFFATGDHRVVSNGKWVKIEDMLHMCCDHDILEL